MKKICVFLGSNIPIDPRYEQAAQILGRELAKREITLIYGGASIGLMGILADAVLAANGKVIGVMPKVLTGKEIIHSNLTELHIVETMQARKKMMTDLADAFIVFPGGLGTLEEMMEVWNSLKINLYRKPLGILNINNYFDFLFSFFDRSIDDRFLEKKHLELLIVGNNSALLLDELSLYLNSNKAEVT